jgi:hypothetical protein
MKIFSICVYYPYEGDDSPTLLIGPNKANLSVLYDEFAKHIGTTWENHSCLDDEETKQIDEKVLKEGLFDSTNASIWSASCYAFAFAEWLIRVKNFKTLKVEEKRLDGTL